MTTYRVGGVADRTFRTVAKAKGTAKARVANGARVVCVYRVGDRGAPIWCCKKLKNGKLVCRKGKKR